MNHNFKNLVFEGGGVKGIAYGGALEVLDKMKILSGVIRVAGTSAGAINAVLVALGYTSTEVSKIIAETNFKDFEDKGILPQNVYGIFKKFGWYKGDAFKEWIGQMIKAKTGSSGFTFGDLNESISDSSDNNDSSDFKSLYLIATNLSQQKPEVFSHEKTPNVPISDATRMSMSIPLYFRSVKKSDHFMVDGGVAYNYPINLFDHKSYLTNQKNIGSGKVDPKGYLFNHETLGFRLDSKETIQYNRDDWDSVPIHIKGIKDYALGLVNFMMEMANKGHLKSNDWNRTVFIDTLDVKTTEFELSADKIARLIKSGETCTIDYFSWRDSDPEWKKYPV